MADALFKMYEIGRELREPYVRAKPPRLAPVNLIPLVDELIRFTDSDLVPRLDKLAGTLSGQPATELSKLREDAFAWSSRVRAYRFALEECPDPADINCTLWTVVAPLFFGYYDGPDGTAPQTRADVFEPFLLSNQLSVLEDFTYDSTGVQALWKDLKDSASALPQTGVEVAEAVIRASSDAIATGVEQAKKRLEGFAGILDLLNNPVILVGGVVLVAYLLLRNKTAAVRRFAA